MVHNLPAQYMFLLVYCYSQACPHPVCQKGKPNFIHSWYREGHPITYIPLPVADTSRPWGSQSCTTCQDFCAGHYICEFIDANDALSRCIPPPSSLLNTKFATLTQYPPSQQFLNEVSKETLITPEMAQLWLDHLHTVMLN